MMKKRGPAMKRSITKQMILMIIIVIALVIGLCFLLNFFLLGKVYQSKKYHEIYNMYEEICTACKNDELYSDDANYILCEEELREKNLNWVILDHNWYPYLKSVHVNEVITENAETIWNYKDVTTEDGGDCKILVLRHSDQKLKSISDAIETQDPFDLDRHEKSDMDYIILIGNLPDSNRIVLMTPLKGIRDSVRTSNIFMMYVGLIAAGIGILIAVFRSRRMTKPLVTLNQLSKRMAAQDFDVRFQPQRSKLLQKKIDKQKKKDPDFDESVFNDEINELGMNFNHMSDELQQAIGELKQANLELQADIERKNKMEDMRKEFLSNVSHELKTPIALIQGYAEGLEEGISDDPESQEYYLRVIIDEANKMNQLVRQLMTLNQLEFGKDQLSIERFDLSELIRGVASATEILREESKITLQTDLMERCPVWGDEFKIEEVLTNYMSNAIHHCGGRKIISITMTIEDDRVRVDVFNTGTPIPDEDLQKIWDKFFKVDKARTRAYGGSGVGLSIVKAIMQAHDMPYGVENREDGVDFWFELQADAGSAD